MKPIHRTLAVSAVILAAALVGCSSDTGTGENQGEVGRGEHDRDGREHDREGGEESGIELGLTETYDKVRKGVRLILSYDEMSNAFLGTVENTTNRTLERIRVEVHLSNGVELGPTTPADLAPGKKRVVKLTATKKDFERWTAHPEVGSSEHGHGEHDREGKREHEGEHR